MANKFHATMVLLNTVQFYRPIKQTVNVTFNGNFYNFVVA